MVFVETTSFEFEFGFGCVVLFESNMGFFIVDPILDTLFRLNPLPKNALRKRFGDAFGFRVNVIPVSF